MCVLPSPPSGSVEEPEVQVAAFAVEAPQSVEVEVEQGDVGSVQDQQEPDTEPEPQPQVQAEPEQEAEETPVASDAEVVAAAFDQAADDGIPGQADGIPPSLPLALLAVLFLAFLGLSHPVVPQGRGCTQRY